MSSPKHACPDEIGKTLNTKISLGFSPCPNDTFMFDAMIHGKINTEGLEFQTIIADVEKLNQKAFKQGLDITKLSYHAFAYLVKDYILLTAGSALGTNCGPILISNIKHQTLDVQRLKIAIPGKYTTANFLLSLAYPEATNKVEILFSDIEDAVLNKEVDAGLIIHENRFTYQQKGLKKLLDLGEYWENIARAPIPLGGIAIKRDISEEIKRKVNRILRRSIEYAIKNHDSSRAFVKQHAKEMDEKVIKQHINLYVNDYSLDLGTEGKSAVLLLFEKAVEKEIVPNVIQNLFLDD